MKYLLLILLFSLSSLLLKAQNTLLLTSEADTLAVQNAIYSCNLSTSNPALTFTCSSKPSWLNFTDLGNGSFVLDGTPASAAAKTPVTILASDGTFYTYALKVQQQVSQAEFDALKDLYISTNGANWTSKWDFSQNNVSSKWKGLTVSDDGRVIGLILLGNNLQGTLPTSLGNLSNLINIDLSRDSLTGEIPKSVGNITNLETLNLFINSLSGEIPSEIGNLTKLIALNLQDNQLSGKIPATISQLSNLEQFIVTNNQLSGDIPASMVLLSKLKIFSVSDNNLSSLPDFRSITSLTKLKVKGNHFFFKDLEPNITLLLTANSEYRPQDILTFDVGTSEKIIFNEFESLVLSTNLAGTSNRYLWNKVGVGPVAARSSSADFTKPNCNESDAGLYYCQVTNAFVVNLTYTSTYLEAVYNHYPVFAAPLTNAAQDALYSYNINVTDVDAGNILTINCLTKPSWLSFTDLGNGKAVLTGTPTSAEIGAFSISLQAKDGVLKTNFPLQNFTLNVANVNDAPTNISLSSNRIGELASINSYVGTLSTQDIDTGDSFTYSIVGGDGVGTFAISSNWLRTAKILNYKTKNTYSLRIRSTDAGGLSTEKDFTITIIDDNNPPTNLQINPRSVVENTPMGQAILSLSAYDEDGDNITYSFLGGNGKNDADNTKFSISGNTLINNTLIDYETQHYFSISLMASDGKGGIAADVFTFEIINVNDNAPIYTNSIYSFSINENSTIGTPNILTVNAFDPDYLNTISYNIFNYPLVFDFNPTTGELSISKSYTFDYEKQSVYQNVIIASDGVFSTPTTVTLYVRDVNESPSFSRIYDINASESNRKKSVLISGINDGDSGLQKLQFSATTNNSALLSILTIDYTQGQSTATLYFDIQGFTGGTGTITLTLKDDGTGANTYSQTFTINVENVNDTPTITIPKTSYSFYEDEALVISSLTIDDKDAGNNLVTVQLSVQNGQLFLKQNTGLQILNGFGTGDSFLSFKGKLSDINAALSQLTYQNHASFIGIDLLNIYVSDNGFSGSGGEKTAQTTVSILVTPVGSPIISLQPATQYLCSEGIATLKIDALGRNLKFQWKKDGVAIAGETAKTLTIPNASLVESAEYSCVVSNFSGAIESMKAKVYVRTLTMQTSIEDVKCFGEYSGKINITAKGGYDYFAYYLNDRFVSATNENLYAGSYRVKVVDSQNCSLETTVTINQPQKLVIQDISIKNAACKQASGEISVTSTGGAGANNYILENTFGIVKIEHGNIVNQIAVGTYVLKVRDANLCTVSQNVEIQEVPSINVQFITQPATCKGADDAKMSVSFDGGTAPYSLMWTNYTETHTITNISQGKYPIISDVGRLWIGNYRVEITDKNGCLVSLSQKLEEPTISLSVLSISNEFCSGKHSGAMWVSSEANCQYSLNGIDYQSNGYFDKLNSGTHTITVKTEKGCTDKFNVTVGAIHESVILDFDLQYVSALGAVKFFNKSSNADSCQWIFDDGTSTKWSKWGSQWSPVHVYQQQRLYAVKLKGSNLCGVDSTIKMVRIGMSDIEDITNTISIYPNPTRNKVYIPINEDVKLTLYSNLGQKLYSGTYKAHTNSITLDLSTYTNGLYIVEIETKNGIYRGKIMKIN